MLDMRKIKMDVSTKVEIITCVIDSFNYMEHPDRISNLINDKITSIYVRNYKYLRGRNFKQFETDYEPDGVMLLKANADVVEIISVDITQSIISDGRMAIMAKIVYRDMIPASVQID